MTETESVATQARENGAVVVATGVTRRYGAGDTAVDALRGVSVDGRATASSPRSWALRARASRRSCTSSPASTGRRSGSVEIAGTEITDLGDTDLTKLRREHIGFVFQFFNLLPMLTAEENIVLPLSIAGEKPDPAWFDDLIASVGLKDRLHHRPAELSGGQQQRVAIARALVSRPSVIFADEPTGNLDSKTSGEILELLRHSVRDLGQTIVMVTHDARAAAIADRILFLADGLIVKEVSGATAHDDRRRDGADRRRVTRFALKGMLGRKLRTVLTALAIVLGVAMVSGTFVLTDSIDDAFNTIFTEVYRGTDATITGKTAFDLNDNGSVAPPFDESRARRGEGTAGRRAGGRRRRRRRPADRRRRQGDHLRRRAEPRLQRRSDAAVVQQPHARRGRLAEGRRGRGRQVDRGQEGPQDRPGDRRPGAGPDRDSCASRASSSSARCRRSAARPSPASRCRRRSSSSPRSGKLDQIRVAAKNGCHAEQLVAADPDDPAARHAGAHRRPRRRRKTQSNTNEFISFLQKFLLAFGGIALFVGAFVIANSLSITIAQRTREFATLRTLGASRRQVLDLDRDRGARDRPAGVGHRACLLGLGLAKGLFALFDAVGFTLPNSGLLFQTRTIIISLLVGVIVTLLASLRPAIRATRVPPIAAVREGATLPEGRFARFRTLGSALLTAAGFAALLYGIFAHGLGTTQVLLGWASARC